MIPKELLSLPNWIRWEYKVTREGKKTKIPLCIDGKPASTVDPKTWTTYDNIRVFDKIGFVFEKKNGIIGIDLDNVLRGITLSQWTLSIIEDCNSYTEFSPSGTGLHIFGFGEKPQWIQSRYDLGESGLELYDSGRYFTVTGIVFKYFSKMREIDLERVFDFLKPREVEQPKRKKAHLDPLRLSVHDVIAGYMEEENCTHPFHGSTTGANFRIDKGGETWRCWRHGVTGNALHLLGIKEGIIQCGDKPTKEQWKKILQAAETQNLIVHPLASGVVTL